MHIVPCAFNKCVYVIEDHPNNMGINATVYRVMADGTVSKRWNINTRAWYIRNVSVGDSGRCLVVTTWWKVFVYVASTGLCEHVLELTQEENPNSQAFEWYELLDATPTILATIRAHTKFSFVDLFFGDQNCMLCIIRRPGGSIFAQHIHG